MKKIKDLPLTAQQATARVNKLKTHGWKAGDLTELGKKRSTRDFALEVLRLHGVTNARLRELGIEL